MTCGLTITPGSGTVPFPVVFSVELNNTYGGLTRRVAGRLDVTIASGASYSNWRGGYTNLSAGETYQAVWVTQLPAVGSLLGENSFLLTAEDVTPAPYNQPPHQPAGDTDSALAVVTAQAP